MTERTLQEVGGDAIKLDEEVWDDSLLIHAWDKALKIYQAISSHSYCPLP
jgi:hypothetical protein